MMPAMSRHRFDHSVDRNDGIGAGVDPAPIEIALGGVIVRVRGEADPRALTTVLKALRGRA